MTNKIKKAKELYQQYKFDEAQELFEQILSEKPDNPEVLVFLAKIHAKTQNYGVALNCYNQVLQFDASNSEALTGIKLIKNILQLSNNFYYENPYTDDELYDFDRD
ncbi:MAG: hypothetical protein CVU09_15535 [Bacteroidetes bacterium HGW-Bacteroidetes-4]|jgi:cytochrome c-type biogenesis protein CcmH/NrfG|nr:MAG: hypothetical protein CVU09_15535 [Bacteroidetes bacterium HGW-Bacteroidetes-4]